MHDADEVLNDVHWMMLASFHSKKPLTMLDVWWIMRFNIQVSMILLLKLEPEIRQRRRKRMA